MNETTLKLLQLLGEGKLVSGEALGQALGISRNAVWKQLRQLRQLGLDVRANSGQGYRLSPPLELLDLSAIQRQLTALWADFTGSIEIFRELDSTSDELKRRPPESCHRRVILSEYQSAGRGRRGRNWVSPWGRNIYLSMGWEFQQGAGQLAGLSLLAGLAVTRSLRDQGICAARLKWPNDILLENAGGGFGKLGGCLVEINGDLSGPCLAIIGIGLNLRLPDETVLDQPWADLRAHPDVSRNRLVGSLIARLDGYLHRFAATGLQSFVADWNRQHAWAGQRVRIKSAEAEFEGVALGVDPEGALLLETESGTKSFHGGECSLRDIP